MSRILFGFANRHLNVSHSGGNGRGTLRIEIGPLEDFHRTVKQALAWSHYRDKWFYAQPNSGLAGASWCVNRIFDLPKTHYLECSVHLDDVRLRYLMWVLSFFLGIRLSCEENSYLDSTPVEMGSLVDFAVSESEIPTIIDVAQGFWNKHEANPHILKILCASINLLFMGQSRTNLEHEVFLLFYYALDACYKLAEMIDGPSKQLKHADRILWMLEKFGIRKAESILTPKEDESIRKVSSWVDVRNDAIHEGLFFGQLFSYINPSDYKDNWFLDMKGTICRILCAILETPTHYIGSKPGREIHALFQ